MPVKMEAALKAEAAKHKNWSQERKDRYVYGAMRAHGWKPKREMGHAAKEMTGK